MSLIKTLQGCLTNLRIDGQKAHTWSTCAWCGYRGTFNKGVTREMSCPVCAEGTKNLGNVTTEHATARAVMQLEEAIAQLSGQVNIPHIIEETVADIVDTIAGCQSCNGPIRVLEGLMAYPQNAQIIYRDGLPASVVFGSAKKAQLALGHQSNLEPGKHWEIVGDVPVYRK